MWPNLHYQSESRCLWCFLGNIGTMTCPGLGLRERERKTVKSLPWKGSSSETNLHVQHEFTEEQREADENRDVSASCLLEIIKLSQTPSQHTHTYTQLQAHSQHSHVTMFQCVHDNDSDMLLAFESWSKGSDVPCVVIMTGYRHWRVYLKTAASLASAVK